LTLRRTRRGNQKLIARQAKNKIILGIFLFGTSRFGEFWTRASRLSASARSAHVLTRAGAYGERHGGHAKDKKKTGRGGFCSDLVAYVSINLVAYVSTKNNKRPEHPGRLYVNF